MKSHMNESPMPWAEAEAIRERSRREWTNLSPVLRQKAKAWMALDKAWQRASIYGWPEELGDSAKTSGTDTIPSADQTNPPGR